MNAQNASLITSEDLSAVVETVVTPVEAEAKTPRTRRKPKPYEEIKTLSKVTAAKKEEKKNGVKSKKALETGKKPVDKKTVVKPAPKKTGKKDKVVASGSGVSAGNVHCSACGKLLTKGTSIENGMGPECARQAQRLPKGMTFQEHYEEMKVVDLPKGFIKLREAIALARKKGVTPYRFFIAVGGNRMLRPPLSPAFKVVFYKGARYVHVNSTSDKELKPLLA